MTSSSSGYLLPVAASAAVVALSFVAFRSSRKEKENSTAIINKKSNDSVEDCISEEDVVKIFDRLFVSMQGVLAQLTQHIQKLQMSGQMIPQEQLQAAITSEFERALQGAQHQVFEEFNIDEDCLEEATWEFLEQGDKYPKAKKAVERFQRLWENISGQSIVGKIPGIEGEENKSAIEESKSELLPPEKLLEVAAAYFDALTNAMKLLVDKYKENGEDLNNPAVSKKLQMEFAGNAEEAGENALESFGVSLSNFQKSISTHSQNPQVGRALHMLQMQQQQALGAMGLANI